MAARRTLRLLVPVLVLLPLAACDRSPGPDSLLGPAEAGPPGGGALDHDLTALLEAAADGRGVDFFRMPDEHQLALIPQDPANPLTRQKVDLGRLLYHETALGVVNVRDVGHETYSCASCHHARGGFMANLPQGMGEGGSGFGARGEGRTFLPEYDSNPDVPDCQPIRTPTTLNSAYQELMLWNGQFGGVGANLGTEGQWLPGTPLESNHLGLHGLETQAHAGLAVHRSAVELSRVEEIPEYRARFRSAFPGEENPVHRLNAALAIAAYERTLLASRSPFQRWLQGNRHALSDAEKRGAIVFFGEGDCVACHTGPALSSMAFHALGMGDLDQAWDAARVNLQPFGGSVPDATRRGRGGFTADPDDDWKFKVPQLYNLLDSPFYGHGASFASVREVIEYKNAAVPENPLVPLDRLAAEFVPLGLEPEQIDDLVAFVETGLYDPDLERYVPRRVPSGNCFPDNDTQSQLDLGCGFPRGRDIAALDR